MTDSPKPELTDEELVEFRTFLAERKAKAEATAQGRAAADSQPSPGAPGPVPGDGPDEGMAYQRGGGGGIEVDLRRALQIIVVFILLGLAALVILLTISAAHQNSRLTRLQQHGVPVDVTVTGCVGVASGTGVTEYQFNCRGTYSLGGHSYNEVIKGTSSVHTPGDVLHAVTVPGDPALLSTADAVRRKHTSWTPYITPAILLVVLVGGTIGLVLLRSSTSSKRASSKRASSKQASSKEASSKQTDKAQSSQ